jgi:LacI family gluconate utilization system Gnt-I transcriptional repressor
MDACRAEIGRKAAEIILARSADEAVSFDEKIELTPRIAPGDTMR